MPKLITRKLELFSVHAHSVAPVRYADLFRTLAKIPREERIFQIKDYVVGLPIVEEKNGLFFIRATDGDTESSPLVFDRSTGSTRENILDEDEILSEATHLVIDPSPRRAAIEYVRSGAKYMLLSEAIEGILREKADYPEFRFEFAPIIRKNFIAEINRFERIREASIRVKRPNISWSKHYTDFSDLMEDSDGDKGTLTVKAKKGRSLKKNTGLVRAIKDVVNDRQPYMDDASVTGTRADETSETTVRAKKHITHTKASIQASDSGVPDVDDIRSKLSRSLARLRDREGQ